MPELPEVETVARYLRSALLGKTLTSYSLLFPSNFKGKDLLPALVGQRLQEIRRKGKFLIFEFDSLVLVSHLRMEGHYEVNASSSLLPYERLSFGFGKNILHYGDKRKFGTFDLMKKEDLPFFLPLLRLGKEPSQMEAEELYEKLMGKTLPIKSLLLDQSLLSGIGNIYADEILYACRISPRTKGKDISFIQCQKIIQESRRILDFAIENGGSKIATFETPNHLPSMQNHLRVYGRKGECCPQCGTRFTYRKIGGRGTTYCPVCQTSPSFVLGITGPIHCGKSTATSYFASKGYAVFDADREVKSLYRLRSVQAALKRVFGKEAIQKGAINAPYLREALASNVKKKREWENYLDPLLFKRAKEMVEEFPRVVFDVPLLPRSSLLNLTDAVIFLSSPEETRMRRLENEGKDAEALLSLNADYPMKKAAEIATFRIENSGSKEELFASLSTLPLP